MSDPPPPHICSLPTNNHPLLRRLTRNQQNYIFPVILSEEILPSSIFYGTAIPILGFYFVKNYFIDPFLAKKEAADMASAKEEGASRVNEKRREAITYRHLMQETYRRMVDKEAATNGLIIERAVYGDPSAVFQYGADTRPIPDSADAFDVTVAVQVMLADNSTLAFSDAAKCHLPGFFDLNYGRPKQLLIRYRCHNKTYQVLLDEREPAALPNERTYTSHTHTMFATLVYSFLPFPNTQVIVCSDKTPTLVSSLNVMQPSHTSLSLSPLPGLCHCIHWRARVMHAPVN